MTQLKSRQNSEANKPKARDTRCHQQRQSSRKESTIDIIERLLLRQVPIRVDGEVKRVSVAEAIVLQLMQKVLAGKPRAWRALLKYQEFANGRARKAPRLTFAESDYTTAFAKFSRSDKDD